METSTTQKKVYFASRGTRSGLTMLKSGLTTLQKMPETVWESTISAETHTGEGKGRGVIQH
mgnify:CR=1 FL=1